MFSDNIDMLTKEKISLVVFSKWKIQVCVERDCKSRILSISQLKYKEGILKRFNIWINVNMFLQL